MDRHPTLTLAFLTHAPASAAHVLEQMEASEAAAFFEQTPTRLAVPVISSMSSWAGARCIERLSAHKAAAVLQGLHFHDCIGLVRLIAADRHAQIFDALPVRLSRRLRNALQYPIGTVGAWIDPDVPAFTEQSSVGDAVKYVRESTGMSHVFLHPQGGDRFVGAVSLTTLMRSDALRSLAELPTARIRAVPSRATLASVASLDEWDHFLMLPVIGRNGSMVGGLSRAGLRRGLRMHRTAHRVVAESIPGQLLSALAVTCAGLLHVITNAEEAQRREDTCVMVPTR